MILYTWIFRSYAEILPNKQLCYIVGYTQLVDPVNLAHASAHPGTAAATLEAWRVVGCQNNRHIILFMTVDASYYSFADYTYASGSDKVDHETMQT